jgi:hypothetical protein
MDAKSFSSEKEHKTIWNRRKITIGIAVAAMITIAVASLYAIHKPLPPSLPPMPPDPPALLSKVEFMDEHFPISKKAMWDDQKGSFILENQIDAMSRIVQDGFYRGNLNWIARQYEDCGVLANKFTADCFRSGIRYFSHNCDDKYKQAQDTCSFARQAGEMFCSQSLQDTNLQDVASDLEKRCKDAGLL